MDALIMIASDLALYALSVLGIPAFHAMCIIFPIASAFTAPHQSLWDAIKLWGFDRLW